MRRIVIFLALLAVVAATDGAPDRDGVEEAMRRAAESFHARCATRGGYVYFYAEDLSRRWGEGEARPEEIWVQSPGTPRVGLAYLAAYEATGEALYLDLAKETAHALVHGQLESGGWRNSIDFDPSGPRADRYRERRGNPGGKNYSTLDDGITQDALRFLIRYDRLSGKSDRDVSEAVAYALDRLLAAQFPNGAFPQVWQGPVESHPVARATYPDYDWRTENRIKNYWDLYTLNDGVAGTMTDLLIEAERTYGGETYRKALERLGEFLVSAQMPDPQPAWAQQYDYEMRPVWARAFEPPAIAARESEDVMFALLHIAAFTGEKRFLEPVVPAVKYLESSRLPDGRLPRYLELETNRPLYMSRSGRVYSLTHDDGDLPSHYGWKNEPQLESIKQGYRAVAAGRDPEVLFRGPDPGDAEVEAILRNLDKDGLWFSVFAGELLIGQNKFPEGERYLASEVFAENLEALARWLQARR